MFRNRYHHPQTGVVGWHLFLDAVLSLALICSAGVVFAAPAKSAAIKPDPEVLLIEIYKDLAADHLRVAQAKAEELVAAYPNFRLGQLIRGDLLMMNTHPVSTFGDVPNGPQDQLKNLREEAIAHLNSFRERPDPNLVPRDVLQLRDDQKRVLIVDAKHSRLYVYENQDGQLKFVTDYYVSQGKLGVNKIKAGDQKTPLGVYYITSRVPGSHLPDLYGAGALPINYPNEWDRINGRSGYGIWLHGTPSDNFSRPPLSSDGCVVLTNPDLHKLYDSVEIGKTPVVIADHVDFVSKDKWMADRAAAVKLVDSWRQDVESTNPTRLLSHYSRNFKSARGENLDTWFGKHHHLAPGVNVSLTLKDSTFFYYPGVEDMIVGTFTQEATVGKSKQSVRKRQYWAHEGNDWKIVSEIDL